MVSIDVLAAVHHPVRRRIIDVLALDGPAQVGTLARELGQQVGSISHHLRMLERAEVVERAPELASDGRTSWWRYRRAGGSMSWSVDDFAARPVDRHRARAAERLNFEHQVAKVVAWSRREASFSEEWRRAAYSTDSLAKATPAELEDLMTRLLATVQEWKDGLDPDDGQAREPVFLFSRGFPSQP